MTTINWCCVCNRPMTEREQTSQINPVNKRPIYAHCTCVASAKWSKITDRFKAIEIQDEPESVPVPVSQL